MTTRVHVDVWSHTNGGLRSDLTAHPILIAAITRTGWGTRAEFLGRYRFTELPDGLARWTGEAEAESELRIGTYVSLQTPFASLSPIGPLDWRPFMPKVKQRS